MKKAIRATRRNIRRGLAILLSICMIVGLMPATGLTVYAADTSGGKISFNAASYTITGLRATVPMSPVTVSATHTDGTALKYTATDLPTGLVINQTTGEISGTPAASGSSGTITVTASEAENSAVYNDISVAYEAIADAPIPLGQVTGLLWSGNSAQWTEVTNASSYEIKLYTGSDDEPTISGSFTSIVDNK